MFFSIDPRVRAQAKTPHELAVINLIVFNLLIGMALLAGWMAPPESLLSRYRWIAVAVPLAISLLLMGFTWIRAARASTRVHWFVAVHWHLAASRYRLILIAYLACLAILCIPLLSGGDQSSLESRIQNQPPAMQEMARHKLESVDVGVAVWARIAVLPLLLGIMVGVMLESGSIYQASRGEVPDQLATKFPPPPDLPVVERSVLEADPI